MKYNLRNIFLFSTIIFGSYSAIPTPANAACGYGLALDATPTLGEYIPCLLENVWSFLQVIFVALGVILLMINVLMYLYNRSNPKALEAYPSKFMYLIAFFLLTAGFGATLIDIFLKVMGLGGIKQYIDTLNSIFSKWDKMVR